MSSVYTPHSEQDYLYRAVLVSSACVSKILETT